MEIVYFVLGIVSVLLVLGVVIIVRVGTLVKELKEKVREFEIHIDGVHRRIDDVAKDIYQRIDEVERSIEDYSRKLTSSLDSRLDKLENKIKSSKDL
jgi:predicted PurR-regulated permease PerM